MKLSGKKLFPLLLGLLELISHCNMFFSVPQAKKLKAEDGREVPQTVAEESKSR